MPKSHTESSQPGNAGVAEAGVKRPEPQSPPHAAARMLAILERAKQGDKSVLDELQLILDANPELWTGAGDLVRATEKAWIARLAPRDLLFAESLRKHIERLKIELAGESPTPLERLLAARLALLWLASQEELIFEAVTTSESKKVVELRLRRAESTNRRFLAAAKALATVRRLRSGLRVEIHHAPQAVAPRAADVALRSNEPIPTGEGNTESTQDRLNALFRREIAADNRMAAGTGTIG